MNRFARPLLLIVTAVFGQTVHAVTIDTVPVGNPGNAADTRIMIDGTTGYGAVGYDYRIGKVEVTNAQYAELLNAVAKTDTYGLYNTKMSSATWGGIVRTGSSGSYVYSVKPDAVGQGVEGSNYTYANKPVVYVSWYDTLRFANWLHNGQPAGQQNTSTTEDGAYKFSSATIVSDRNVGATWFLPLEDEWYKAAYYDGGSGVYDEYPTSTNTPPNNNFPSADTGNSANFYLSDNYTTGNSSYPLTEVGAFTLSASSYGTFDQAGNVWEWNEERIDSSLRGFRGGAWNTDFDFLAASARYTLDSAAEDSGVGFRVASAPAPPVVPGDFDGDGDVDGADFVVWQTNFPTQTGATLATGDADGDGDVDGADFVIWQTNFPYTPDTATAPVAEPATLWLAGFGIALILLRRAAAEKRWFTDPRRPVFHRHVR